MASAQVLLGPTPFCRRDTLKRTKEIGMRRAIGVQRGDIRTQLLIEAITISALGGL